MTQDNEQPNWERSEQAAVSRHANTRRLHRTVIPLVLIVGGMTGMAFAAVPLYDLFCRVTGYGGTTQVAGTGATQVLDREITIRFDANVSPKLDWEFKPAQPSMKLNIGESGLAVYEAHNPTDHPLSGTATYNVTPEIAGYYFNKVQCFCFTEQKLVPGRRMDMPVSFFVDPAIVDDPEAREIEEITLSYTFFPMQGETRTGAAGQASEKTIAASR